MCVIRLYTHHKLVVHHHPHLLTCDQVGGGSTWGASFTPGHSSLVGSDNAVTLAGVSTVPEIPPWAMLLIGVGLILGMKKRRRVL